MSFHALLSSYHSENVKTEGDRSGGYKGKLDKPIVNG